MNMIVTNENIMIAIKIPTYNSEITILDTLESIINQTYANYTVYIFDNCSTDNTLEIIASLNDNRIKIIKSEKNYGWAWNFNRCLNPTGEEMMLFAHSDDIYHPSFLEINLKQSLLQQNSLIFSKGIYFKNKKEVYGRLTKINDSIQIDEYSSYEDLLNKVVTNGNFIFCPTAFGKSEIFSTVIGKFNESDFKGSADLDAWLRVSKLHSVTIIKKPILFFYRLSNNQISYWDRKKSDSYFARCINFHVQSLTNLNIKKDLSFYIRWHEIYHSIFVNIDEINCSKLFFFSSIYEVIKLKVKFLKKFKLLGLLCISLIIILFPYKIRLKLNSLILRISR